MSGVKTRKRNPKGQGYRPMLGIRIKQEEHDKLQAIADAQGVKKSDVARTALEGWLRRNQHLADQQPSDVES